MIVCKHCIGFKWLKGRLYCQFCRTWQEGGGIIPKVKYDGDMAEWFNALDARQKLVNQ